MIVATKLPRSVCPNRQLLRKAQASWGSLWEWSVWGRSVLQAAATSKSRPPRNKSIAFFERKVSQG